MKYQLATYQIRREALPAVLAAIREFVAYVKANENDTTLRYEAWQEKDDPTKFTHIFTFRDQAAEDRHSESAAVKKFSGILYPQCLEPVKFTDFDVIATTKPQP